MAGDAWQTHGAARKTTEHQIEATAERYAERREILGRARRACVAHDVGGTRAGRILDFDGTRSVGSVQLSRRANDAR